MAKQEQTALSFVVSLWAALQGFGAAATGLAMLLGGAERFSGPSTVIPSIAAPWWVWGALYMLTGTLHMVAARHRRHVLTTGLAVALIHGLFAAGIAWSVASSPTALLTGPTTYAGLMVITTVGAMFARHVYAAESRL